MTNCCTSPNENTHITFVSVTNPEWTFKGKEKAKGIKQEVYKGKEKAKEKMETASEGHEEGMAPGKCFYTPAPSGHSLLAPSGRSLERATTSVEAWWDYIW